MSDISLSECWVRWIVMTNIHHECNEFTDAELRHVCAASFHRLQCVCVSVCTIDADTKHNNTNTFYGTAAFIQLNSRPPTPQTYPLPAVAVETTCRAGENCSITVRGDNLPSADKTIKHDLAEREGDSETGRQKVHCKATYALQSMLRQISLQMGMVRHKDVDVRVCKNYSCNQELRKYFFLQ